MISRFFDKRINSNIFYGIIFIDYATIVAALKNEAIDGVIIVII
jgi:hypothetical protein